MSEPLGAAGARRLLPATVIPPDLLDAILDQLADHNLPVFADRADLPDDTIERMLTRTWQLPRGECLEVLVSRVRHTHGRALVDLLLAATGERLAFTQDEHTKIVNELSIAQLATMLTCDDPLVVTYVLTWCTQLKERDVAQACQHAHDLLAELGDRELNANEQQAMTHLVDITQARVTNHTFRNIVLASSSAPFLSALLARDAQFTRGSLRHDRAVVHHAAGSALVHCLQHTPEPDFRTLLAHYGAALPIDALRDVAEHRAASQLVRELAGRLIHEIQSQMPRTSPPLERQHEFADRFITGITAGATVDVTSWTAVLVMLSHLGRDLSSSDAVTTVTATLT